MISHYKSQAPINASSARMGSAVVGIDNKQEGQASLSPWNEDAGWGDQHHDHDWLEEDFMTLIEKGVDVLTKVSEKEVYVLPSLEMNFGVAGRQATLPPILPLSQCLRSVGNLNAIFFNLATICQVKLARHCALHRPLRYAVLELWYKKQHNTSHPWSSALYASQQSGLS